MIYLVTGLILLLFASLLTNFLLARDKNLPFVAPLTVAVTCGVSGIIFIFAGLINVFK